MPPATIHVVALVCWREGRLLTVRKRGHQAWFQPGGKPEAGEGLEDALRREIREELGCELGPLGYLGTFETLAANEPGSALLADMFEGELLGDPDPREEIEACAWRSSEELLAGPTAPLILDHVLRSGG